MPKDLYESMQKAALRNQTYRQASDAAKAVNKALSTNQRQFLRKHSLLLHAASVATAMIVDKGTPGTKLLADRIQTFTGLLSNEIEE